ncbi:MAG: transporter [Desulfobaccales bacterium]
MNLRSVFGLLCLWMALWMVPGWANDLLAGDEQEKASVATAAKEEGKPASKEEAKEDECPPTFGPIITDTAIPLDKGKFAVQPTFGLGFVTNNLTQSWRRVSAGGDFKNFGMDWKFTYGLIKNMEVFVVVPYVNNWANSVKEPGPNGERSASFGGLGDVNLTMKYQLLEEGPKNPTVTALFATGFPTGHFNHLNPGRLDTDILGGGAYAFTTGLNTSKCLKPFILYANLWYTMQTAYSTREDRARLFNDENGNLAESDPASTQVRNYPRDFVTVNLAAEYLITDKWIALLELTSYWDGGRLFGHQANLPPGALLSVNPGIEYMVTEKLGFAMSVNFDLIGKNATTAITPLFSCMYQF